MKTSRKSNPNGNDQKNGKKDNHRNHYNISKNNFTFALQRM